MGTGFLVKQRETVFKEKVLQDLTKLPNTWFVKIQQVVIRGTPDILACVRGHFVALELKTETGVASSLQMYNLQKIRRASGMALVAEPGSWLAIYAILEDMAHGRKFYAAHPMDSRRGDSDH